MKTIHLSHDYPCPPETLWALVTDLDALAKVAEGIVVMHGLPSGRIYTGQSVDVMVSLFGKLPAQPYHMAVLECDDTALRFRSAEKGAGVKSWNHTAQVTATETGSRLTESIQIDAGLMTWAFAAWARYLYRARHAPRLRMLKEGTAP